MSDADQGVDLAVGPYHLAAKGNLTVVVVSALAVVATILFSGYRIERTAIDSHLALEASMLKARREQMEEHKYITKSQDIMSCILTLTPDERKTLREHYYAGAFQMNCPWMGAEP